MAKLNPEQLAQLKLMKETLVEMHDELEGMPKAHVWEMQHRLRITWVKALEVLAHHGVVTIINPPAPPKDNHPF